MIHQSKTPKNGWPFPSAKHSEEANAAAQEPDQAEKDLVDEQRTHDQKATAAVDSALQNASHQKR